MTVIDGSRLAAVPWRNGKGVTREIMAVSSADATLLWRLSLATIDSAAPFSTFAGIDRLFLPVAGRVRLEGAQAPFPVTLGDADALLAFAGEIAVTGAPLDGQVLALNLMVCRGWGRGAILRHGGGVMAADAGGFLVFAPRAVTVRQGAEVFALGMHDTLVVPPGREVEVSGPCIRLFVTPC
jgi:uncharacterized protein